MSAATLEAGRELDALVAEKVMGWPVHADWLEVERLNETGQTACHLDHDGVWRIDADDYGPWKPSTDIAAAWEVVEKMASHEDMDEDAFRLRMRYCMNPEHEGSRSDALWEAIFGSDFLGWFRAYAPTAPLAICRAALAALEAR